MRKTARQISRHEISEVKTHANSDLERYRHHLDQLDVTDEQKLELVNALRIIVESILDKKFGLSKRPQEK